MFRTGYPFFLSFVSLASLFGNEPPPKIAISAKEHAIRHPSDLKLERDNRPFPFNPNPVTKDVPKPWPKSRVLAIPQGRCLGIDGVAITQDNMLLMDASYQWHVEPHKHRLLGSPFLPPPVYYDAVVAEIGALATKNYYHWMIDVLPRIGLIEEAGIKPDFYHTVYPEEPFREETLAILGIGPERIIPAKEDLHIQAKTLIVPTIVSMPERTEKADFMLCAPMSSIQFLRKKFLLEAPKQTGRRIYISRKNARGRRVLNEEELVKMLEPYGFEFPLLENMSVVEQAKLFASAELIVAPHGAGLTNIVFCNPKAHIIELSPRRVWSWTFCFWAISQQLKLHHTYLRCKNEKGGNSDMTVTLSDLEREVKISLQSVTRKLLRVPK
ncbi:MAG: glycosyltransferase family 61 protein [Verrucomicrobia bacterium]|nr:glycosyltransferase family 61 protein [Verrucomicrobiota bacterium]